MISEFLHEFEEPRNPSEPHQRVSLTATFFSRLHPPQLRRNPDIRNLDSQKVVFLSFLPDSES